MENVRVVILAAGLGKRMGSDLPKGLIHVGGKPMLAHVVSAVTEATENTPIVVVGHKKEEIMQALQDTAIYVEQKEQLGTAHALLVAKDALVGAERIVVLYGDHPFVSKETIRKLLEKSKESDAEITMATTVIPNFENEYKVFSNFARILRNEKGIVSIREYKDANQEEKNIKEVNPGYYVLQSDWLWPHLEKIKSNNAQGERYLTDLIYMASKENLKIESIGIPPREAMGANCKEELEILESLVK